MQLNENMWEDIKNLAELERALSDAKGQFYAIASGTYSRDNSNGEMGTPQAIINATPEATEVPGIREAARRKWDAYKARDEFEKQLEDKFGESYCAQVSVVARFLTKEEQNRFDAYLASSKESIEDIFAPVYSKENQLDEDEIGFNLWKNVIVPLGNKNANERNIIPIDEEHFPDEDFRNYIARNCSSDGKVLTPEDIAKTTKMDFSGYEEYDEDEGYYNVPWFSDPTGIEYCVCDLTGIEYFTALKELYCTYGVLETLDVSGCAALEILDCGHNKLTTLDVSGCAALKEISCENNCITTLDISNNTALEWLYCSDNGLTTLDIGNNTAIKKLYCGNNKLTSLDVSNNTALEGLYCSDNDLATLNVSSNTKLTEFDCDDSVEVTKDDKNKKIGGGRHR